MEHRTWSAFELSLLGDMNSGSVRKRLSRSGGFRLFTIDVILTGQLSVFFVHLQLGCRSIRVIDLSLGKTQAPNAPGS